MPEIDDCEYCSSSKRLRRNSRTCTEGNNNNNNEDDEDTGDCAVQKKIRECVPESVQILLDMPVMSYRQQLERGWNPLDSSINIDVKLMEPLTLHRHPVAQSTDAIRGRVGYVRGVHAWKVQWKLGERGTHAVVGVSTRAAGLHCHGYCSLVGADEESWGWDVARARLVHGSGDVAVYGDDCVAEEQVIVLLDMDLGTLSFSVGDRYLGVAFRGLQGRTVYPTVSAVWGHCEISMTHLASLEARPVSLLHLCRFAIRQTLVLSLPHVHHSTSNVSSGNSHQHDSTSHRRHHIDASYTTATSAASADLDQPITELDIPEYLKQYLKTGSFRR